MISIRKIGVCVYPIVLTMRFAKRFGGNGDNRPGYPNMARSNVISNVSVVGLVPVIEPTKNEVYTGSRSWRLESVRKRVNKGKCSQETSDLV